MKREEFAQVADELFNAEDHRARWSRSGGVRRRLRARAEVLRVGDFIFGDEPRAEGAEGVAAFAFGPLAAAVFLVGAFADVVRNAVAGDIVEGVRLADVLRRRADDDAELDFPIGLRGAAGDADVVVRADDGAGGLHKEDRLLGDPAPVSAACSA